MTMFIKCRRLAVTCSEPFGMPFASVELPEERRLSMLWSRVPTYRPPQRTIAGIRALIDRYGMPNDTNFAEFLKALDNPEIAPSVGCRKGGRWSFVVGPRQEILIGVSGYIDPAHLENPDLVHACPVWPCTRAKVRRPLEWEGLEGLEDCPSFGAETVPIINAERDGIDLTDGVIVSPYEPCQDCWSAIRRSGIKTSVYGFLHDVSKYDPERYALYKKAVQDAGIREVFIENLLKVGVPRNITEIHAEELAMIDAAQKGGYLLPGQKRKP